MVTVSAVTLPLNVTAPVDVAAFSCRVNVPSGSPPPTSPVTVAVPLPEMSVKFSAAPPAVPFTVPTSTMLPAPVSVSKITFAASTSASLKTIPSTVVETSADVVTAVKSLSVKPPSSVKSPVPNVSVPAFVPSMLT